MDIKRKWKKWVLPTKIGVIASLVSIIALIYTVISWLILPTGSIEIRLPPTNLSIFSPLKSLSEDLQEIFDNRIESKKLIPFDSFISSQQDTHKISIPNLKFAKTGYISRDTPIFNSAIPLKMEFNGFIGNGAAFSDGIAYINILSSGEYQFIIDSFYIKLHGFSPCTLRNETSEEQAIAGLQYYEYFISENHSTYNIIPLKELGSDAKWSFQGKDYEEYYINFFFKPYVLYVITFELRGRDLKTNKYISKTSGYYPLIKVTNGNTGGCLSIDEWFTSKEPLIAPNDIPYQENSSLKSYQFLIADKKKEENLLLNCSTNTLAEIHSDLLNRTDLASNTILQNKLRLIVEKIKK